MYAIKFKMILATLLLVLSVNGCGGSGVSISVLPSTDEFTQNTNADVKIDILFVIDDSGSMSQEQQALFDNFKSFIELFYDKGFDFRVAVAKTSAYGHGQSMNCKQINQSCTSTNNIVGDPCNIDTWTNRTCSEAGTYKYSSGLYISRESGRTPAEFRCGFGNNCGVNSQFQSSKAISGTVDPDAPPNDPQPLVTTIGNGTPADGTDHILASSNLTKTQMISKFKKNILVGLDGSGDERGIEAAETVIRNMKSFYSPANEFPRPNAHMAIIHLGDEGDGAIPNVAGLVPGEVGTSFNGSNRGGASSTTTGSLRSSFINTWAGYSPVMILNSTNMNMDDHLASVDSYLDALKAHDSSTTVSVHAIEDLPSSTNVPYYMPAAAFDSQNSSLNNSGNGIGYYQAYMANQADGLILSKSSPFGPSLSDLGDTISSLASFFTLGGPLDAFAQSNLKVYVEGINGNNPLPNSNVNGYQYEAGTNRIRFFGSMIPPQGAIIGIQYTCGSLDPMVCYTP